MGKGHTVTLTHLSPLINILIVGKITGFHFVFLDGGNGCVQFCHEWTNLFKVCEKKNLRDHKIMLDNLLNVCYGLDIIEERII